MAHSRVVPRSGIVVLVPLLAALLVVAYWISSGNQVRPESRPGSPTENASASDTLTVSATDFVAYESGILFHPRVLPHGFELCGAQLGRPVAGDVFCDPTDQSHWLRVRYADRFTLSLGDHDPLAGVPGGAVLSAADPIEVAAPVSNTDVLVFTGSGLSVDELTRLAVSVPLVGERKLIVGNGEPKIDLAGLDFERLLDRDLATAFIEVDERGELMLSHGFGAAGGIMLIVANPATTPLVDAVVHMSRPRLITDSAANFVVSDLDVGDGRTHSQVLWADRGWVWNLMATDSLTETLALARGLAAGVGNEGER